MAESEKWTPMTDAQREQWRESGLFPVERWTLTPDATPLVCPMPDRELLRKLAEGVPAHVQASGWYATKQRYEQRSIYADNFRGMGRQAIASICSDRGRYFGTLADYMAAACPRTVLRLLDRIEELERAPGVRVDAAVPQIVSAHPLPDFRLVQGRRALHEPDRWERLYEVTTSDGMTGELWLRTDGVAEVGHG